jgi:peptidyl-prolyl cis-trans isomerase SurA
MNKKWLTAVIAVSITLSASSQTLFTFGDQKVDVKEFQRAYKKNNSPDVSDSKRAMKDYLDLYINSRLKISEAYERGYDKLPQIEAEVANLRGQIIENYLSDPDAINRLTKEAFDRSQKDIHVAHLFISLSNPSGVVDTVSARKRLEEVMRRLSKGEDFTKLVKEFSDEPSAKATGGDMGFVTVFTLPYEFENVVYTTPVGKYSAPHRSKIGFHIFKNINERKAAGKVKAAQILLAFPPGASEDQKRRLTSLADSLHKRIVAGDDFGKLAAQFSNDYVSAANGGTVPDIGVGQFDPTFEQMIWSLSKDGAVTKPFLTDHGYHIVKRLGVKPVVTDPKNQANLEDLRLRINADDRWRTAKDFIYERVKTKAGFKWANFNRDAVWAFSDSVVNFKPAGLGRSITMQTPLFTIADTTIDVIHWIAYAQAFRFKSDRSGTKPWPELMEEFSRTAMFEYYRNNLETFNEDFANQMKEFKDGNLFFEIMQNEIWNKAQADSNALLSLYEKNKSNYNWKKSADAVIFFASDEETAKAVQAEVKKSPANWRKITENFAERLVTDSSRYEWDQVPGLKGTPKEKTLTPIAVNVGDNTVSFAYIVNVYTSPSPRTFTEAKGMVMNDYQTLLEEEWIKRLREKYKVKVDEKVWEKML